LAEEHVPPESADVIEARRERMLPGIAKSIRTAREGQERRARLRKFGALSLAAIVVLAFGFSIQAYRGGPTEASRNTASAGGVAVVRGITGTLVVTHGGRARVVSPIERPHLTPGDELRTASDGSAEIQTERSAIHLQPATQVSMFSPTRAEERIRLSSGQIDLKVSRQSHAPRSVVVETPNADVVVRGTTFSVSVDPAHGSPITKVSVTEGSVWVLHAGKRDLVSSGEAWSSDVRARAAAAIAAPVAADASATKAAVEAPGPTAVRTSVAKRASRTSTKEAAPASTPSGTLGEENRMFQLAVDARNRGEDRRALELFGALLNRYPGGRLAEEARIERMRALRRLGDSLRAASEARRYLSDFTSGFAREEARSVALGDK
jgi:hypothetical protein